MIFKSLFANDGSWSTGCCHLWASPQWIWFQNAWAARWVTSLRGLALDRLTNMVF